MDQKGLPTFAFRQGDSTLTAGQVDIFGKDVVIFPINIGNSHWTAAAINFSEKRFEYYDSMGDFTTSRKAIFRVSRPFLAQSAETHSSDRRISASTSRPNIWIRNPSRSTSPTGQRFSTR